ncbi:hypothetical protein [Novipirellula caenicola]|uniref:Uncharacterized protein n=1 Tax=Novipirellula caenicola TaxID=1536901 RepID=A0ABP9VLJ7_9BACT
MLPRLIAQSDTVVEPATVYNAGDEDEYRVTEYEYEEGEEPEPNSAPEDDL